VPYNFIIITISSQTVIH